MESPWGSIKFPGKPILLFSFFIMIPSEESNKLCVY